MCSVEPQDSLAPDMGRAIASLLATIRLDGVILTPPLCDMAVVLDAVEAAGVPYVRVSPSLFPGRSALVEMDDTQAAYEMTQFLLTRGHKDIGFVRGHPEHGSSHRRYDGFIKAMHEAGAEPHSRRIAQGFNSFVSGSGSRQGAFHATPATCRRPSLPPMTKWRLASWPMPSKAACGFPIRCRWSASMIRRDR